MNTSAAQPPMATFMMGRHPALPPSNNLLQLPNNNNNQQNNSGGGKRKIFRSLSKSKIPSDAPQDAKPHAEEGDEKEINIPPSAIRDTLLDHEKITLKVSYAYICFSHTPPIHSTNIYYTFVLHYFFYAWILHLFVLHHIMLIHFLTHFHTSYSIPPIIRLCPTLIRS